MLHYIVLKERTEDCTILFRRALLNNTVSCFGSDGGGKYSQHYFAAHYSVKDIAIVIDEDLEENLIGTALIHLDGYDSDVVGHAATDANLTMTLNTLFATEFITRNMWDWAPIERQGRDFVAITFDVDKVLGV